MNAVLFYVLDQ